MTAALNQGGHRARLLAARGNESRVARAVHAQASGLVFLAIPDQAVAVYSEKLRDALAAPADAAFVHLSGALTLQSLAGLRSQAAGVGSFHPLQSFAAVRDPDAFRDILIAVDASDDSLLHRLTHVAESLGARARRVPDDQRALYHAAAVLASNYLVALAAESAGVLQKAGWNQGDALRDLLPLMQGTLTNLDRSRAAAEALTGPIRRGDVGTIERNLAALDEFSPEAGRTYRILGLAAVELAVEAGLEDSTAARIRMALTRSEQRPGGAT